MRIAKAARAELRLRYLAKEAADRELATYLLGVLHQAGLDPARYRGFDDVTGEVLLGSPGVEQVGEPRMVTAPEQQEDEHDPAGDGDQDQEQSEQAKAESEGKGVPQQDQRYPEEILHRP